MHTGHRERVRTRFISEGLESLPLHNIMELLLFYSIPRCDTNETAHRLVDKFGSLSGILDADYEELKKVPGIGENSAVLIKLLHDITDAYYCDKTRRTEPFDDIMEIVDYFKSRFIGDTNEVVRLLLLNADFSIIRCEKVSSGSPNSTVMPIREIVRLAIMYNASAVAIAHNHPYGIAEPSDEDIKSTFRLEDALRAVNVYFFEHFIFAGDKCATVINPDIGNMEPDRRESILSQFKQSLLTEKSGKGVTDK